ncbi:thioredoxin-dependent thiol peroxidase [Effusibacillus dendaii]|uniref:thioredoxin-dependent peroxiredoxin n=1 Tax=Effusibacillus dendaii TaxID=2743772 RepID=A0A7I8D9V9_9BACL|nr:thioredoxin-dependent thiol peroxidase [Effusibacillus dendaii]BCJ86904.1 peroxiredoxin [Effusibacillus dendaii]
MTVNIGQAAPDFELTASDGQTVKLSQFKGKNVVIYFYPKDMTPGCTTEACDFRDHYKSFAEADTVVLGISPDPVTRHQKFIEKYELPFILLSDENHTVAEIYGVWKLKKNYGKEYMGIERSTFVIDRKGNLVREWRNVRVKNHVDEVLDYVNEHLGD